MVPYPYMYYPKYAWLASTYKPPELGSAEIDILYLFAEGKSQSAYDIFKKKRLNEFGMKTKSNYKDVHKRVKRLVQLKLIYQIEEHFERGAKHFRITPYGLITSLDKVISDDHRHIRYNKDNNVIRWLLLDFFEEETIDSFHLLKDFPARNLEEYLHDCCSITSDICRRFWTRIQRYNIIDILPSDDIVQKYMSHLNGRPVEEHIFDEIKEYEKRLAKRLDNNAEDSDLVRAVGDYNAALDFGFYDQLLNVIYSERPPFPLLDIYIDIPFHLIRILEEKTGFFIVSLVTELGKRVQQDGLDQQEESEWKRELSLDYILKDKRFIESVSALKKDFDKGYKQFSARLY